VETAAAEGSLALSVCLSAQLLAGRVRTWRERAGTGGNARKDERASEEEEGV
jgi:hypothetical protein